MHQLRRTAEGALRALVDKSNVFLDNEEAETWNEHLRARQEMRGENPKGVWPHAVNGGWQP